MLKTTFAVLSLVVMTACSSGLAQPPVPALRDGDLIFQTSRSAQSTAVQRATHSRYSHMGMVVHRKGKPFVLEAAGTVRYTALDAWVARGRDGHFVVKRLRHAEALLTRSALERLMVEAGALHGKPYDATFEWSDRRVYCSELVWKIYDRALGVRIGTLQQLRDFDRNDPAVRAKLRERYGDRVPLDEPVISPVAMFVAPELELVVER